MAISCIFLCCRGDSRVLFLPREREVEVSSLGSLLKRKDMAKRGGPDQRPSEDGEAVFIQRLSPERGCRRGEKLWITESFPVREEWPVVQSSQHHGTGSTKKPMLPRQNRAEDHWGGRKKIPDSPFKLFGRRSEAGVVVAEQLLIVRVRLRDRSSALMDWPDWLERAVLVQRVPLSPSSHAWASRPMIQHNRPTTVETTHPPRGAGAAPASQLQNLGSTPCRRALHPITPRALTR